MQDIFFFVNIDVSSGDDKLSREKRRTQLFKGVAELGLLRILRGGPEYGLRILDRLRSDAGLEVAEGTLYPLLYRLEKNGLIVAEWRLLDDVAHPRKYYVLTEAGAVELKKQTDEWLAMSDKLRAFLIGGDQG